MAQGWIVEDGDEDVDSDLTNDMDMAGRGGGRDRQSGGGGPRWFDGGRGSKAPPSRHLWIGNLSHGITEDDLTRHFLNFGDLESVAF
ncbi:hypothetical protein ACLB2K_038137 [Fragaria x ananassa]